MSDLYIWVCCVEPTEPMIYGVIGWATLNALQEIQNSLTDGFEHLVEEAASKEVDIKLKANYTEADPEPPYYDLVVVGEIPWGPKY